MSELRWHPVLGEWVITATHRQDRTFMPPADYCPICPTRPNGYPTEVPLEKFEIVVFENRFPSLRREPPEPAVAGTDLTPIAPAEGVCEVILYSDRHEGTLADRSVAEIMRLVRVWEDRYRELGSRPEIRYVYIFENKGEAIGVTLPHPHGQLYAFPYIPPRIARTLANEEAHHARTGGCLHCDLLDQERRDGRRIVGENAQFVAMVPFYARYPYEVHLYAREHIPSLAAFTPALRHDLARMLKQVMQRYDGLFGFSLPYMMCMFQEPTDGQPHPGSHFRIEFYPPHRTATKLKYLAGCETGAGSYINDTLAEEKAAELRAVAIMGE